MAVLKRYLIERDVPGIGGMSVVELCGAARASNAAIGKIKNLHWQHSYVAGDKTFCIYLATSEEVIRRHAERHSGHKSHRDPTNHRSTDGKSLSPHGSVARQHAFG